MRYSVLSAPIACSLALHLAALQFGWEIFASDAGVSAPWRRPALRARLVAAAVPAPAKPAAAPIPLPPPAAPRLARTEVEKPLPPVMSPPAPAIEPVPETPAQVPARPAELPDSAFLDQGGVDEMARPLIEPEYDAPKIVSSWTIEFDLLIDASGKPVRVENVSEGAPRDITGAILAAFFTVPYEPAKLAGQPVAIRQRFQVQPFPSPLASANLAAAPQAQKTPCGGAC